jgi:hypothetical protein
MPNDTNRTIRQIVNWWDTEEGRKYAEEHPPVESVFPEQQPRRRNYDQLIQQRHVGLRWEGP